MTNRLPISDKYMSLVMAFVVVMVGVAVLLAPGGTPAQAQDSREYAPTTTPIKHFIVLMQENHSFDNYFGTYPGADGIPPDTCIPIDPFDETPPECIRPFHIGDNEVELGDPDHSDATHRLQYNEGKMNGFVHALELRNQDGRLAMGYYDDRDLMYHWNIADEYVLFDRFFSSAAGGSSINHVYWVAGVSGDPGDRTQAEVFAETPTIFDRLEEAGISWKFYVQNYEPELNYRTVHLYPGNRASQVIWVPLLSMDRFLDDPELSSHIVNLDEYYDDLVNGTLPAVAFIAPSGPSEHPPSSLESGQRFVKTLIQALMRSEYWSSSAFMWSYDDWGGWYDHVPPPQVDEYGYGFRVPALLVSPYAKRGYIDSTELDFTSMLKFIEENWGIKPLAERDTSANNITNAFDFSQEPRAAEFVPYARTGDPPPKETRRGVIYLVYAAALAAAAFVVTIPMIVYRDKNQPTLVSPDAQERDAS